MKILFLGTSGVHHPLIAANMFIGRFKYDLRTVNKYCDTHLDRTGYPIYVGDDPEGNQVYTLGVGKEINTAKKALACLLEIFDQPPNQVLITEIRIKGEAWIRLAMRISRLPFGSWLNQRISDYVLQGQLSQIETQVEELRHVVRWVKRARVDSEVLPGRAEGFSG